MTKAEQTIALHAAGQNCAQAVLGAFCESYQLSPEEASRLSAFFGGGMRIGSTCGAATGALMVLGLQFGGENNRQCTASREFLQAFTHTFGTLNCRELLRQHPKSEICPAVIQFAAQYLEEHCK